jgi:hypothetical protein
MAENVPERGARREQPTSTDAAAADLAERGFDVFDPSAPYFARLPYERPAEDDGPWPDLEVSRWPVGRQPLFLGDGPFREMLHRSRIGKPQWAGARTQDRRLIKESLNAVLVTQLAIHDLLDPDSDDRTRDRARAFLLRISEKRISSEKDRNGYVHHVARTFGVPTGHAAFRELRTFFTEAAAEARAAQSPVTADWLTARCDGANAILLNAKPFPLSPICTIEDVRAVVSENDEKPAEIALELVGKAMSTLSRDDVRRPRPRSR